MFIQGHGDGGGEDPQPVSRSPLTDHCTYEDLGAAATTQLDFYDVAAQLRRSKELWEGVVNPKQLEDLEAVQRRRVPCMIAYLHPFRLVSTKNQDKWNTNIEQINSREWDYIALHELTGGIDVGLQTPYHLVIGRDGALALRPIEHLRSTQAAVEFFNRCLAGMLLGGIYCEAISPDGLAFGSIIDWTYIRVHSGGQAAPNRFHDHVRRRQASPLEAIGLMQPRQVELAKLQTAAATGLQMLDAVPSLRGEYLLKGTTALARLDWGSALANLWIVVEQLVAELWRSAVVEPTLEVDPSKTRRDQLMDTRSWTASTRIEMLFQKGVIDADTVRALSKARKARNDLHHTGKHPAADDARAAYEGATGLLTVTLDGRRAPLLDLNLADHALIDAFGARRGIEGQPTHWMPIPKLPGEAELEQEEARVRSATRQSQRQSAEQSDGTTRPS